jgi:hypothetical protein
MVERQGGQGVERKPPGRCRVVGGLRADGVRFDQTKKEDGNGPAARVAARVALGAELVNHSPSMREPMALRESSTRPP